MVMTVATYGGGEILRNLFNAIAMLMNSQQGGLLRPMMVIMVSVGTVWAVLKAFFSQSGHAFLGQFLVPLIAVVGLLMVPTTTVHIEDILKNRSETVAHVPLLLAKFGECASSLGYQITKKIESVMHAPDDVTYNSTGMLFGADTAMDLTRYKITNADLERNLRTFSKQCVFYDVLLGQYSIDALKKTTDLWKFLDQHSSNVRMIKYTPIGEEEQEADYITCKDAIRKMQPYFDKEKAYYAQHDICKNLPLTFQALTGISKNSDSDRAELVGQQLMMNLLAEEGEQFAQNRAYLQQRNTYQVLGGLASNSLVTLRAVVEALVYAAFIFVIPLAVLPRGIKFLTTWAGLVVWIELWPPFYSILNYIMQSVSHGYAHTVFHGLAAAERGLSLFTSVGLYNLQQDIFALSGYLAASIPFISYAILKGGVGSFVHLASSMMSPAHSAASAAAVEQTTGNYSFGNTSFGQTAYRNTTAMQTNVAPSLSGGFFHENTGDASVIHGQSEHVLRQSNSELRTSLFSDDSISQGLQTAQMHAHSAAENAQKTYTENTASHVRNLADLSSHLAQSESYSAGISTRDAYDIQESARYFQNVAENFGKQHNLSASTSAQVLLGMGVDLIGNTAKTMRDLGSNRTEVLNAANQISKGEEFQKHLQKLHDISQSEAYHALNDTGKRLVESCSHSMDTMKSSQESYQTAESKLNQLSDTATWAQQNSQLIKHSLNQDFINWASAKYADEGGFSKVRELLTHTDRASQSGLVAEFLTTLRETTLSSPNNYVNPDQALQQSLPAFTAEKRALKDFVTISSNSFSNNHISQKKEELQEALLQQQENHVTHHNAVSSNLETRRAQNISAFSEESKRSLYLKQFDLAATDELNLLKKFKIPLPGPRTPMQRDVAHNFQITETPFWMEPN